MITLRFSDLPTNLIDSIGPPPIRALSKYNLTISSPASLLTPKTFIVLFDSGEDFPLFLLVEEVTLDEDDTPVSEKNNIHFYFVFLCISETKKNTE